MTRRPYSYKAWRENLERERTALAIKIQILLKLRTGQKSGNTDIFLWKLEDITFDKENVSLNYFKHAS
jgi:hypothetical protein